MSKEITEDWLTCFDDDVKQGEDLSQHVFWRLAVDILPEGVNGDDSRVQAAIEKIKESIAANHS